MSPETRPPHEIRVLILEDNVADALLMVNALERAGFEPKWERVENETQFTVRLSPDLDLILSDFALPQFSGLQALRMTRSRGLDIPFILVSGSIGEETAVQAMREGADDYLLKDRMARIGPAVRQALEQRRLRADKALAEAALRQSEAKFRALIEQASDGIFVTDAAGNICLVNSRYREMLGYDGDELLGLNVIDTYPPEDRISPKNQTRAARLGLIDSRGLERRIRRKDGTVFLAEISVKALDSGFHQGIVRDITERKQQQEGMARLNRIYAVLSSINSAIVRIGVRSELLAEACRIAVDHGGFGMAWIGMVDARTLDITPVAWAGFEVEEYLGSIKSSARGDHPLGQGVVGRAVRERATVVSNDLLTEPSPMGHRRSEAIRRGYRSRVALPLMMGDAAIGAIVLFAKELDFFNSEELKLLSELAGDIGFALQNIENREQLDYLSYYDTLTGLPNRSLFIDRTGQQLRARGGEAPMVAVILINLERFRNINETFGRHGGDDVLKQVARRLEEALRGKDYLARTAADGFGVVIRGMGEAAIAHVAENQILACFHQPFVLDGVEVRVAARAGIAMFPADGADADALFKNAEAALKNARSSAERYLFYAAEMNARAAQVLSLENRLRKAVEAQQFVLHYQPKIALASGRICGLEALIRWQEPGAGLVPPGTFIPVLEETGLILEVGRWVLSRALADHREWTGRGLTVPRIAANVSAIQLQQRDFADMVIETVQQSGAGTTALELEVTESLLMKDVEASIRKLSLLRATGIQIAMDDFGTGYSSLSYIARLPLNSVKIDRSFVSGVGENEQDLAIVTTIIALAHSLKLRVVAEGVETHAQSRLLRLLKCDEAQGYLFSRPVPAAELAPLLRAQGRVPVMPHAGVAAVHLAPPSSTAKPAAGRAVRPSPRDSKPNVV